MSKRIKFYLECDGCHRTELDGAEIVQSLKSRPLDTENDIHLCSDCYDADKYYCHHCRKVHNDDNPCEAQRRMLDDAMMHIRDTGHRQLQRNEDGDVTFA